MQVKAACTCAFGALFLFVSAGSANVQRHRAEVTLRPSLIDKAVKQVATLPTLDAAMVKLASLPGAAESFILELGAPETRDPDTRETIDAPKDAIPTPLERARA